MKTLLTLFIFLASFSISAQSLSEQMGGVFCEFQFYSNNDTMDVIKQLLIERPTAKTGFSTTENESYGYGYAYTDWRLEFVSNSKISTRVWNNLDTRKRRGWYEVTLRNQAGGILVNQYIHSSGLRLWEGKLHSGWIYTYSVNLTGIPLIVLDNVASIDIVLIE